MTEQLRTFSGELETVLEGLTDAQTDDSAIERQLYVYEQRNGSLEQKLKKLSRDVAHVQKHTSNNKAEVDRIQLEAEAQAACPPPEGGASLYAALVLRILLVLAVTRGAARVWFWVTKVDPGPGDLHADRGPPAMASPPPASAVPHVALWPPSSVVPALLWRVASGLWAWFGISMAESAQTVLDSVAVVARDSLHSLLPGRLTGLDWASVAGSSAARVPAPQAAAGLCQGVHARVPALCGHACLRGCAAVWSAIESLPARVSEHAGWAHGLVLSLAPPTPATQRISSTLPDKAAGTGEGAVVSASGTVEKGPRGAGDTAGILYEDAEQGGVVAVGGAGVDGHHHVGQCGHDSEEVCFGQIAPAGSNTTAAAAAQSVIAKHEGTGPDVAYEPHVPAAAGEPDVSRKQEVVMTAGSATVDGGEGQDGKHWASEKLEHARAVAAQVRDEMAQAHAPSEDDAPSRTASSWGFLRPDPERGGFGLTGNGPGNDL